MTYSVCIYWKLFWENFAIIKLCHLYKLNGCWSFKTRDLNSKAIYSYNCLLSHTQTPQWTSVPMCLRRSYSPAHGVRSPRRSSWSSTTERPRSPTSSPSSSITWRSCVSLTGFCPSGTSSWRVPTIRSNKVWLLYTFLLFSVIWNSFWGRSNYRKGLRALIYRNKKSFWWIH